MVRIRRKLDSDTLHLPVLKPLIGKTVNIIVNDAMVPEIIPGTGDWDAAQHAAQQLRTTGYDFEAWREQREYGLNHARDRLL